MVVPRWLRAALVAVPVSLFSSVVQALGVGELQVNSALDEPLSAEIPLTPSGPKETKTLQARLVARPDFDVAADATAPMSGELRVKVAQGPDGQPFLKLYSERPVREPYIRFLLQLDWVGGRLTREFVALIDPRHLKPAGSTGGQAAEPEAEGTLTVIAEPSAAVVEPTSSAQTAGGPLPEPAVQADTGSPAGAKPAYADAAPSPPVSKPAARQRAKPAAEADDELPAGKKPDADEQRERLASEIKAWAKAQEENRPKDQAVSPDADEPAKEQAAESKTAQATAAARAAANKGNTANDNASGLKKSAEPAAATEIALLQWVRENAGRLLMVFVAVLALITGTIAAAWAALFAWKRWRPRMSQEASYGERRRGEGRRRQFLPVAIERRRGPRRDSDNVVSEVSVIHAGDEHDDDVGHLETNAAEPTELTLQKAICAHPQQHSLKVKLLGLYYQNDKKQAFESLLNRLYADLVENPDPERQVASAFDDLVQQSLSEQQRAEQDMPQNDDNEPSIISGIVTGHLRYPFPEEDIQEAVTIVPIAEPRVAKDGIPVLGVGEKSSEPADPNDAEPNEPKMDKGVDWDNDKDIVAKDPDVVSKSDSASETSEELSREDKDGGLEQLSVDDLVEIGSADGDALLDSIEFEHVGVPNGPEVGDRRSGSKGKGQADWANHSRRKKSSAKDGDRRRQWRDPAIKIDLAKAYIDMGDPERARHILDEVLANWQRGDGTDG